MRGVVWSGVLLGLLTSPVPAWAGLYYSREKLAELPARWRGFLLDQRTLRRIAVPPRADEAANPARLRYQNAAARLAETARTRPLHADEAADLGAVYVRLGEVNRALEVLRPAQRIHPRHFSLAANLGTAWQLHGDLGQAAMLLQQAVRLAPAHQRAAEELHLRLVRQRLREPRGSQTLDDLFGVRYVGSQGVYKPGQLAAKQRQKLPNDAAALVQQLALWLPADARLLWQLAELASAQGDVATAAAIMDGCVTEFGLRAPQLRSHRQAMRQAAAKPQTAEHAGHARLFKPRSARPLLSSGNQTPPAPIDSQGVNELPWTVINETTLDSKYRPTFARYLKRLDGKQVKLSGYVQPLGEDQEMNSFLLIEYPVGCWYCEAPEMTGIVLVELPEGKTLTATRGLVHVTGTLVLNARDPENFLYTLRQAKVREAE